MRKLMKGNNYDSRMGGRTYAMWTTGHDVCITEEDGKKYFYRLRNFDHNEVESIEPVEILGAEEITWEEVNEMIRKKHFRTLYPNGSEAESNLFVFGQEKGSEINSKNEWADAHLVFNREITLLLAEELGNFEKVEELASFKKWGERCYVFIIEGKWQVTVSHNGSYATYSIEEYSKIVAQQKAYGRRVARIAKRAGVPWNVASFVGHIESEEEAIEILKLVKKARGTADEALQWELSCGIGRRVAALEQILGETWKKLDCGGQKKTTILADYLLGE